MRAVLVLCILVAAAQLANAQQPGHDSTQSEKDSAFRALQNRGRVVMGVDQYTSAHRFESLPNGGRIELQRLEADSAGVSQIRKHLKEIVLAFQAGDFRTPAAVHAMTVPGTEIMRDRKDAIRYEFGELPRGGEIRIVTTDAEAVAAVHDFLAFQRRDHRTGESHRH